MTTMISAVLWNTLIASSLALLVGLLGRTVWWRRRPAAMHTLWMIVLAKFVTPALVPLPVLPATDSPVMQVAEVVPAQQPATGRLPISDPDEPAASLTTAVTPFEPQLDSTVAPDISSVISSDPVITRTPTQTSSNVVSLTPTNRPRIA